MFPAGDLPQARFREEIWADTPSPTVAFTPCSQTSSGCSLVGFAQTQLTQAKPPGLSAYAGGARS